MSAGSTQRVVVVAGGTGALGSAIARAFLDEGATVVVTYRHAAEYDTLRDALGSERLMGRSVDATDPVAAQALVDGVVHELGQIDVLVNAIGGYAGGAPLWELDAAAFERMLSLNLRAAYALARAAIPGMVARGEGAWVNIAAKAGVRAVAGAAAYSASKAAAIALVEALAAEVAGTGVRVNSVLPSIIDSEANRRAMPGGDFAAWPKASEIAGVVRFLCGEEGKVVRGAALPVYGAVG